MCIVTDIIICFASNLINTLKKLNIEQVKIEESELEIVDRKAGTSKELEQIRQVVVAASKP